MASSAPWRYSGTGMTLWMFAGGVAAGQLWVFLLVPLVGGVVAALVYRALFRHASPIPDILSAVTPTTRRIS